MARDYRPDDTRKPTDDEGGIEVDWSNPSESCCPWPVCFCAGKKVK
jgi:hypothetical protein